MEISAIKTVFFSPTKTSQKIAHAISEGARTSQPVQHEDLTLPTHNNGITVAADELTIIAVPVYAGRVAPVARERLKEVSGNNSPAILVVLYGNRDFEDALIELKQIVENQSFTVVAASAFIGEHSYSTPALPTAQGRPDDNDLSFAREFGTRIMQKLTTLESLKTVNVPGNFPYKEGMPNLPFTPTIETENCTLCEECISVCPTGAIRLENAIEINPETCTFCCACIKTCPATCISLNNTPMAEKIEWLHTTCQVRKEPELFV